jgi:hypothetical protein
MKKIAALFAREIREKALIFPGALAVGVFPLALSRLRIPHAAAAETRDFSAALLAFLMGGTLAVTLGFWSTAGDLVSKRASFILSRPLSALQIWGGKLAGSYFLVLSAVALGWTPATIAGGGLKTLKPFLAPPSPYFPDKISVLGQVFLAAFFLAALLLLAQAAGVAALSRSAWLAVDLALTPLAVLYGIFSARRLSFAADTALARMGIALAAMLLVAAAAGCLQAVRAGRIDLRRAHAAQSITFWAFAGIALLGFDFGSRWVVSATPSGLTAIDWVVPAPKGHWIAVSGPARFRGDYRPIFFQNLATKDFFRSGSRNTIGASVPILSSDGKTAGWTTSRVSWNGELSFLPHTRTLDSGKSGETIWETASLGEAPLVVFSDDGSRMAMITADTISVSDLRSGRLVVAAHPRQPLWRWSGRGFTAATFVTPDRLRVYRVCSSGPASRGGDLDILELDAPGRRLFQVGHAGPFERVFPLLTDSRRERLLVRETARTILLLDARSGDTIRAFADGPVTYRSADFLSDGRIALLESERGHGRLRLLDAAGSLQQEVSLGPGERALFIGELRPGVLGIALGSGPAMLRRDARILRVEPRTGNVETIADHIFPITTYARWTGGDPGKLFAPGSEATRLFYGPNGSLIELDEGSSRTRTLIGDARSR